MRVENGKLVLETETCWICDKGLTASVIPCTVCKGTGKGKKGRKRGCKACSGTGIQLDREHKKTCENCKGDYNNVPETYFSSLPKEIWQSFAFKVVRENESLSLNEQYIGMGYVYSCTDYGEAWKATDEKIIEEVKNGDWDHQAIKICKEDGTLCEHIAIVVKPMGFAVIPVFKGEFIIQDTSKYKGFVYLSPIEGPIFTIGRENATKFSSEEKAQSIIDNYYSKMQSLLKIIPYE